MHFKSGAVAALLLLSNASSVTAKLVAHAHLSPRHLAFDRSVRREAHRVIEFELNRRDPEAKPAATTTSSSTAASTSAENFNTADWNATTTTACTNALGNITSTVNDAGMLACYNIPFLDETTGVFEADLRLYKIKAATGDFAGVSADQLSISLGWPYATVSSSNNTATKTKIRRASLVERGPQADTTVTATASTKLDMLQDFQFVGQVNSDLTLTKVSDVEVQALIIPTIELSAPSASDARTTISTNLTAADTAYFVNGVFKGDTISGAAAASATFEASAAAAAAAFVLPGTTFGIFPIGFIVTASWTVLFVLFVGLGTYGRLRFRHEFRARVSAAVQRARI